MNFFDISNKLFEHIGTAGISLLFLLSLYILYRAYRMELPSLDIHLSVINKDFYISILKQSFDEVNQTLDHDLYLKVHIVNSGKRIMCPTQICDDKGKQIVEIIKETGFEYILKEDEKYSDFHPLGEDTIKMIKESKRIYVKDFADRQFPIPKEQLKKILLAINSSNNKK